MILEINEDLYRYTWALEMIMDESRLKVIYKHVTYVFDVDSFIVCRKDSSEAEAVEKYIVFPAIERVDAQRAYVSSLNNKRLNNAFGNLDDNEFFDKFWNYFDDGGQKLRDFEMFEEYYRIKRIVEWCEENAIPYYLNKKDELIKRALDYGQKYGVEV